MQTDALPSEPPGEPQRWGKPPARWTSENQEHHIPAKPVTQQQEKCLSERNGSGTASDDSCAKCSRPRGFQVSSLGNTGWRGYHGPFHGTGYLIHRCVLCHATGGERKMPHCRGEAGPSGHEQSDETGHKCEQKTSDRAASMMGWEDTRSRYPGLAVHSTDSSVMDWYGQAGNTGMMIAAGSPRFPTSSHCMMERMRPTKI